MQCRSVLGTKLPAALLRFFEKEDHAQRFIRGEVRVGLLDSYRAAEGPRRDEAEGSVRLSWGLTNPVNCDHPSLNPYYLLCTSHPDVDRHRLKGKFGQYIVRITDPQELLTRIDAAWRAYPVAEGRCVIVPVVYNKGALLEPTPGLLPPAEYSFCQKPRIPFEEEQEFRFVLTCTADCVKLNALSGNLENHRTLRLPDCSDICSRDS